MTVSSRFLFRCCRGIAYCSAVLAVTLSPTNPANAAWIATSLHPSGAAFSYCTGVSNGKQVGIFGTSGYAHACMWSGNAASCTDLNPLNSQYSHAYCISSGVQGGSRIVEDGSEHAGLWYGSAGSWVDLHPAGAGWSCISSTDGKQQVGGCALQPRQYFSTACLWTGSAGSWVNLCPTADSWASYVANGQQVGHYHYQTVGVGNDHACLWNGTAASMVDLNPASVGDSHALATDGKHQVGYTFASAYPHAALWSGTKSSWIDLHPSVATESMAYGVSGGYEVGYVTVKNVQCACLWTGTAASWTSLQQYLPSCYSWSHANDIWTERNSICVVGTAHNSVLNRDEAMMWSYVVPEPPPFAALFLGSAALLLKANRWSKKCIAK